MVRHRPATDDRRRDAARPRLLAEPEDQVRELSLGQPVHEVGRARPLGGVHAHVERAVVPEPEPALRPIELHRGDPEVEEHAAGVGADRVLIHLGEPGVQQPYPVPEWREAFPREREGLGFAVDPEDRRYPGLQQRRRVAAPADGHVDDGAPVAEQLHHRRGHDGLVTFRRHPTCPTSSPNAMEATSVSAIIPSRDRLWRTSVASLWGLR